MAKVKLRVPLPNLRFPCIGVADHVSHSGPVFGRALDQPKHGVQLELPNPFGPKCAGTEPSSTGQRALLDSLAIRPLQDARILP